MSKSYYLSPIPNSLSLSLSLSPHAAQQPLILGARARNFKWAPGGDPSAFIPARANLQVSSSLSLLLLLLSLRALPPSVGRPESERAANTDNG